MHESECKCESGRKGKAETGRDGAQERRCAREAWSARFLRRRGCAHRWQTDSDRVESGRQRHTTQAAEERCEGGRGVRGRDGEGRGEEEGGGGEPTGPRQRRRYLTP